jgi:hypothetical protein
MTTTQKVASLLAALAVGYAAAWALIPEPEVTLTESDLFPVMS